MKTKIGIMVAPLVAVWALSSPLCAASDNQGAKSSKWSQVEFDWQRVERDGTRNELPRKRKANTIYRKADGTTGSREISAALRLKGTSFNVAKLPSEVRLQPTFVEFMISGTAGTTANEGSIINIDGAIIGFQLRPGGERADIMVLDIAPDGTTFWRKAGMGLPINSVEHITASPRVAVRLDYKNAEWSLYSKDVVVVGGLPLLAENGQATIAIKAGVLEDDTLILKKIQIRDTSSTRRNMFKSTGPRDKSNNPTGETD